MIRTSAIDCPKYWSWTYWAANGALLGALIPFAIVMLPAVSWPHQIGWEASEMFPDSTVFGWSAMLSGACIGALVGMAAPCGLRRLWGAPLWALAGFTGLVGAASGAAIGGTTVLLWGVTGNYGMDLAFVVVALAGACAGAIMGGTAALSWWLPFSIATVAWRGWPVTILAALLTPTVLMACASWLLPAPPP